MCPWQYETIWIGQRGVCHISTIPPPTKVMHDLCHSLNRARPEYAWFEFSSVCQQTYKHLYICGATIFLGHCPLAVLSKCILAVCILFSVLLDSPSQPQTFMYLYSNCFICICSYVFCPVLLGWKTMHVFVFVCIVFVSICMVLT